MNALRCELVGFGIAILFVASAAHAQPHFFMAPVGTFSEPAPTLLDSAETAGCVGDAVLPRGMQGFLTGMTVDTRRAHQLTFFRVDQAGPGAFRALRSPDRNLRSLGQAARAEAMRLAALPAATSPQEPAAASKHKAVKWGAVIGAIAGAAGGALQPTHSNGEYVLGSNRAMSAVALAVVGAGVGALVGLVVEKI